MIQQQNEKLPQQSPNFIQGKRNVNVTVVKWTHESSSKMLRQKEYKRDEIRNKNGVRVDFLSRESELRSSEVFT